MKKISLSLAAVFAATGLMAQGQSVIYSENFDNGIPSTWTQTTNATDGGFLVGNSTSLSAGLYFINVNVDGISKTLRLNVAH